MKKIFSFTQFVNESYAVNEGGGAGIEFKTNVDVVATYLLSSDSLERKTVKINVADTFDAEGYDDGMNGVGSWMLQSSLSDPKLASIMSIPIDNVEKLKYFYEDIVLPEDKENDIKVVGDLFVAIPDLVLHLTMDISFKNYSEMHFGGYVRGSFKSGDIIIGNEDAKYDTGDYDTVSLAASSSGTDYAIYDASEIIDEIKPQLAAKDTFVNFYENVFNSIDDNYDNYIKSELLDNDIDEGDVDEEILKYIDDNDLDITIDDFKKDAKKYVNDDFIEFMRNNDRYNTNKWDSYINGLRDMYSTGNEH